MILHFLLSITIAVTQQGATDALDRAESLFAAGDLEGSKNILERYLRGDRNNYDALMLLAGVHLERPVVGRFESWRMFRRASEVRPDDPRPYYGQALVGERLGGADGERMIREALLRIWEIDPNYPGTWVLWEGVYHGPRQNLEAAGVLARHRGDPAADIRMVRLFIEAGQFGTADSLLVELEARGRDDAILWALRAETDFMRGETDAGIDAYMLALERVESDTSGYLWRQIEAIASPQEIVNHAGIESVVAMTAFYRSFWEKREPDLTTEINERIGEHFARLGEARRLYRIRHPQSRYHRSARWRTIARGNIGQVRSATGQFLRSNDRPLDGRRQAGVAEPDWDVGVREPDSLSRYRRYGLDGRGLVLLRYGQPKTRLISSGRMNGGDVESWTYEIDGFDRVLTFARATGFAGFGGEMVFFPIDETERHNSEVMLERDETAIHPDIHMDAWVAFFRADDGRGSLVYVRSHPDNSAVRIWDATWRSLSHASGRGPLILAAAAGRHTVGIDFRDGDRMARLRKEIDVPRYASGTLSLSSLLISRTDSIRLDRNHMAALMPATLTFRSDSAFTLYAEIYYLSPNERGMLEYAVDYAFIPGDGGDTVTFSFEKTSSATGVVVDRLVIQPGRVRPGVYRVVFRVRDLSANREVVQTRVDVRMR